MQVIKGVAIHTVMSKHNVVNACRAILVASRADQHSRRGEQPAGAAFL